MDLVRTFGGGVSRTAKKPLYAGKRVWFKRVASNLLSTNFKCPQRRNNFGPKLPPQPRPQRHISGVVITSLVGRIFDVDC